MDIIVDNEGSSQLDVHDALYVEGILVTKTFSCICVQSAFLKIYDMCLLTENFKTCLQCAQLIITSECVLIF